MVSFKMKKKGHTSKQLSISVVDNMEGRLVGWLVGWHLDVGREQVLQSKRTGLRVFYVCRHLIVPLKND
jgi:hypothetical protein